MNRSQCRRFSLRTGIGITSHSAHPRAPIGSHIQNVSVDPIQLSSEIVSPQKRIEYNALFQNGNRELRPKLGQVKIVTDACLVDWTGHLRLKKIAARHMRE